MGSKDFLGWLLGFVLAAGCSGSGSSAPTPDGPLTTAIGTPMGAAVTATIGPEGGSLVSGDAMLTLEIPPGALAADTEISVTPISNEAPTGFGGAYRLGPEGITLAAPARVTLGWTEAMLAGTAPEYLGIGYQTRDRTWNRVLLGSSLDQSASTLSVETTHFSDWGGLYAIQLLPASTQGPIEVRVGQTQAVYYSGCWYFDPSTGERLIGPDELIEAVEFNPDYAIYHPELAVRKCERIPSTYTFSNGHVYDFGARLGHWSVNGAEGGDGTFGTVTPDSGNVSAVYRAPNQVPDPAVVAVSVQNTGAGDAFAIYLTEFRIVGASDALRGGFTVSFEDRNDPAPGFVRTQSWSATLEAHATDVNIYDVSGTATMLSFAENGPDWACTVMGGATGPLTGLLALSDDGTYSLSFNGSAQAMKKCVINGTNLDEELYFDSELPDRRRDVLPGRRVASPIQQSRFSERLQEPRLHAGNQRGRMDLDGGLVLEPGSLSSLKQ